MHNSRIRRFLFILLSLRLLSTPFLRGDPLEDIQFWCGSGQKEAAMVVAWNDGLEPETLIWGFRWEGDRTAQEMVLAIVETDPRLEFEYTDWGTWGVFVDAFYYDRNQDAYAREVGVDHVDYGEYWEFLTSSNPVDWTSSSGGISDFILSDGDRIGFQTPFGAGPAALTAPAAAEPPYTGPCGFPMSGIEFWTGNGTNRSAMVVDWHDGARPHALVWGFRWNGTATGLDMWQAITAGASGLTGIETNGAEGTMLSGISYQRPFLTGDLLPATSNHTARHTAYAWDHLHPANSTNIWQYLVSDGDACFRPSQAEPSAIGPADRILVPDSWDVWSLSAPGQTNAPGTPAAALPYPFASAVLGYDFGDGDPPYDWLSGDLFNDPVKALGRPTVDTTGDDWSIPEEDPVPLVPVNAAFRAHELVSIGENGYLALAFDHPVRDNPANPFGLDFIVYGNSFQEIASPEYWENGDPNAATIGERVFADRARVSVSQDGITWHTFTNGPYADDFAPTLGRVYDPDQVDASLGAWNEWWGGPTDPSIPLDPALSSTDWSGMSVAEISRRYRGGAGGTGFDIGAFPLDACPDTGHKWIQYVKIERAFANNVEIDAVAAVSPALPYDRWRNTNFLWMGDPADESEYTDLSGDGVPNLMAYALGRNPHHANADPVFTAEFFRDGDSPRMRFHYGIATNAPDVRVEIVHSESLKEPDWSATGVQTPQTGRYPDSGIQPIVSESPANRAAGFFRLRVWHDD